MIMGMKTMVVKMKTMNNILMKETSQQQKEKQRKEVEQKKQNMILCEKDLG
jgi:hypothetical protein